eukprot:TRINITY_DN1649_c1_g1_i1.p3 TRINITY_DN1649_c1_g1~~TRINITY_DN1649_c1_g1_i1.p3  ORF type:complete len:202 (+),score=-27.20 TRINITY_DN1649_c1_g1_i1:1052-1657(+)
MHAVFKQVRKYYLTQPKHIFQPTRSYCTSMPNIYTFKKETFFEHNNDQYIIYTITKVDQIFINLKYQINQLIKQSAQNIHRLILQKKLLLTICTQNIQIKIQYETLNLFSVISDMKVDIQPVYVIQNWTFNHKVVLDKNPKQFYIQMKKLYLLQQYTYFMQINLIKYSNINTVFKTICFNTLNRNNIKDISPQHRYLILSD